MKYSDVEPGRSWRNYHFGFENECDYKLREEQCDASMCCEKDHDKDYFSREKILTILRTMYQSTEPDDVVEAALQAFTL